MFGLLTHTMTHLAPITRIQSQPDQTRLPQAERPLSRSASPSARGLGAAAGRRARQHGVLCCCGSAQAAQRLTP